MTSANVTEGSRPNGQGKHVHDRTPAEIQLEIARTKSAITDDLLVLSERFGPQQLREGAREVMRDAREEATLLIREAKEATIGSLIGAKDRAVESVKESVSEKVNMIGTQARVLGDQAKRASDVTLNFVSHNPWAVSLVGFGAGWLFMALRSYRRSTLDNRNYRRDYYALPTDAEPPRSVSETVRSAATNATRASDRAREQTHRAVDETRATVERTGRAVQRAARAPGAIASNNTVAVVALTIVAGLGLSLFLPIGRRPRRALLGAGERVWEGAQTGARQIAERARALG